MNICIKLLILLFFPIVTMAHQGSFAYLDLNIENSQIKGLLKTQILDLDLLVDLDGNKDKKILWQEIIEKRPQIEQALAEALIIKSNSAQCELLVSNLSLFSLDKNYLGIHFSGDCQDGPTTLDYRLFFDTIESHKVILSTWDETKTIKVLQKAQQSVSLVDTYNKNMTSFFSLGIWHILTGYDHILFVVCLILPFFRSKEFAIVEIVNVLSIFTLAHSLSLWLAVFKIIILPASWIEIAIALTIIYSAATNLKSKPVFLPISLIFLFGLIHGLGFANMIGQNSNMTDFWPMLLFNMGIEFAQLIAVGLLVLLWNLSKNWSWRIPYQNLYLSLTIMITAGVWLAQRIFSVIPPVH